MKAMLLRRTASLESEDSPLEMVDLPVPEPAKNEVLVRVLACGVCHTELDEIEGRTVPPRGGGAWIHHSAGNQEESYRRHLWLEKEIKTVANVTGQDIAEFLPLAADVPIRPEVTIHPLEEANRALIELKRHPVRGAKVLVMTDGGSSEGKRTP